MSKPEPDRILLTVREGIDADNLRTEILSDWGEAVTGARRVTFDDALVEKVAKVDCEFTLACKDCPTPRFRPECQHKARARLRVAFGEEG